MSYTLVVDALGRPPVANRHRTRHYQVRAAIDKQWRNAGCLLARQAKIPKLSVVTITVHCRYPDRRGLPDCDAAQPALKAVLDGIVDAGVLPDDKPPFVRSIRYDAPVVERGSAPALIVTLEEIPKETP